MSLVNGQSAGICNPEPDTACVPNGLSVQAGTATETVNFAATQGTTYYIVVDSFFSNTTSTFNLNLGTSIVDIQLNEIGAGSTDFVEVVNNGACDVTLQGFSLYHETSCGGVVEFDFPSGTNTPAGSTYRAVESGVTLPDDSVSFGEPLCDLANAPGSTGLCFGPCNTTTCDNLVDYVERADTTDPVGIACATFTGGPIHVQSVSAEGNQSLNRQSFTGGPATNTWSAADWAIGTATPAP